MDIKTQFDNPVSLSDILMTGLNRYGSNLPLPHYLSSRFLHHSVQHKILSSACRIPEDPFFPLPYR